jgi:hypothetical protein
MQVELGTENLETVFEVLSEGGELTIKRKKDPYGEVFFYQHDEVDFSGEGNGVSTMKTFYTFEDPFYLIHSKYPWHLMHMGIVHDDFREFVLKELLAKLQSCKVGIEQLEYTKESLEDALGITLQYGRKPLDNGLQEIRITPLAKITQYTYDIDTSEQPDRWVKSKKEFWADEYYSISGEGKPPIDNYSLDTYGKVQVEGNAIVVRDEFDQVQHVLPSDKFLVSTSPILSRKEGWFYTSY